MDTRQAVANRLMELCSENNISINKLSTMSAVPNSTLKNIINHNGGSKNPGIVTLKKICDALDITLGDFFSTSEFDNLEQEIK